MRRKPLIRHRVARPKKPAVQPIIIVVPMRPKGKQGR